MNGKRSSKNWRAASLVESLMADRGWFPIDLERASADTGHPMRQVSRRSVYRVIRDGYVPSHPVQFEIAAAFGLLPSHIWGGIALPSDYAYLNDAVAA